MCVRTYIYVGIDPEVEIQQIKKNLDWLLSDDRQHCVLL
jgi:hypothetical protein